MALPTSRDLTFIDGVSQFPAATGNNLQDGIANITTGAQSLKAVVIDGVGGAAVTPPAGTLKVSGSAIGAATPTPTTVAGTFYKEFIPIALARVDEAAGAYSLIRGVNIASITKFGTGQVDVVLGTGAPTSLIPFVTPTIAGITATATVISGGTTVRVTLQNSSTGANTDSPFALIIYGY